MGWWSFAHAGGDKRRITQLAPFHITARPRWSRHASSSTRGIFHDRQGDDCLCRSLAGSTSSSAQTDAPADAPSAKGKCAAEVQKFCATVEKGKGLIHACLEAHSSELSEGCKTSMAEHAAKAKEKAQ